MARLRRVALLVLANTLVLAALLLVVDLGARVFFPRRLEGLFNDPRVFQRGRPFVVPHPERGFALQPRFQSAGLRINDAGFRGPELPANVAERRLVLALGESSTFGWLVDDGETYPAQLQQILERTGAVGPVCVVNAGVPSYSSAQVLLYAKELLPELHPDLVIVNVMWNDALYACLENWLPEYLVRQQPAPWRQALLRHSGLYRALVIRKEGRVMTNQGTNPRAVRYFGHNLAATAGVCRQHGAQVLFVVPPVDPSWIPDPGLELLRGQFVPKELLVRLFADFARVIEETAEGEGAAVAKPRLDASAQGDGALFLAPVHLTPLGNRRLARDLAAIVESLLGVPGGER